MASGREEHVGEDFSGVDWYGADLADTVYRSCRFSFADLTEAVSSGAIFEECDLDGARLNVSRHRHTAFLRCTFRRASLFDAEFDGCKLTGSDLSGTRLRPPLTVRGGDWSYTSMRGADLSGLDLADVNLGHADLAGADLRGTVLRDANLAHATLDMSDLRGADLRGADLDGIDSRPFDLRDTRINSAQAILLARHRGAVVDP